MNIIQKIGQCIGIRPTQNYVGETMIEETPKYNPVNLDRLCDLQNRNDRNFKVLKEYISKETDVHINQSILYEIAFDYLLTHQNGTEIIEIIQDYKLY